MLKSHRIVWFLLAVLLISVVPALAQDEYTISLGKSDTMGSYLVGAKGMTVYTFTADTLNTSVCTDKCAEAWPPVTVDSADKLTGDEAIPGVLGTLTRKDNTLQVTYNGQPLYYWYKDEKAGDTTGNRVGHVWWIVPPSTVAAEKLPKVGNVLVGPKGMTLYMYTKDTPDTSTCYDKCATNWPPLTVASADAIVPGVNLPGKWGTTTRTDKTIQVTYNGWPLYSWNKDVAIGDAVGEGVGKVWYTVAPETLSLGKTDKLGEFLTATDGSTLYTFAKDTAGVTNCSGDCAKNWPAYKAGAEDKLSVSDVDIKGKLGTIKLADGSLQVTYNDMPLYYFAKDAAPGDTNGDGAGGVWAVAKY
jgi:predicted lipoprotein with Yx(FWY)xxD motif